MAKITIIPAAERTAELTRVAAYARVSSSSDDQLNSFTAQIRHYTETLSDCPNTVFVDMYADEGITGTQAKKRPEFLKMIRLCRQKKIDLILTKSVSRFARNTVDCLKYVRELKMIGIGVYFEKENIDTLLVDNEMLLTLMSCFAQAESESISKNVAWGVHQSFKNGRVPMQYTKLLGYRKGVDGKPEIVPEEAEIVKEIFRLYLDGNSQKQIADALNERGLRTKCGNSQWQTQILRVFFKTNAIPATRFFKKPI